MLSSYIKCLSRDILCVWRRLVNNNSSSGPGAAANKDTHSKHYTKQLWCFWFNIEPEWKQLIHKDLTTCEQGDYDHGLSYECRTLLFKAYHNLIEQSLVSIGFCKLGKYFIYPIENQQAQQSGHSSLFGGASAAAAAAASKTAGNPDNPHFSKALQNTIAVIANSNRLACSFNFFIHGENSVCCIVDVRLKQPIYQITRAHLTHAQHAQQPIEAILSPFGLSALVTGNSFKESDNQVQKLINDWRKFFPTIQQQISKEKQPPKVTASSTNNPPTPSSLIASIAPFQMETLEDSFNSCQKPSPWAGQANSLPTMIEVAVAGVKMKYPSNFVFMLAPNELTKKRSLEHLGKESNKKPATAQKLSESQESVQDLLFTAISPSQPKDPGHSAQLMERSFKVSPRQPQLPSLTYCIRSNVSQELNCAPAAAKEEPTESNDDIMQSLHRWDIYDVTCKLSCNCSRCKPKKSQKDQLKSSNQSLSKKLDKNNEKENKQASLFKFNIPFHRRNFQLNQAYDLESSRAFLEVTNEPGDKSALTNNNSINNSSQSARLPNYFLKSTHQPPAIHKANGGLPALPPATDQPKTGESLGDENGKQNENSTNAPRPFEEEMFSPYSGDKSNTNSPTTNLAAVQWGSLPAGRSENGLKTSDDEKKEAGDTVVVSSLKQINYFKAYRIGAIKRPHLPAESHLNGAHGESSSSLLYDFESINSLNVNWDVPAPKNQRLIKHDDQMAECQEDCSRDPYEFDDDCMRNSKKNDKTADKQPLDNALLNKVLTREEDITVSYNGPEQIFDSDESNDMFSMPGAPSGNRHTDTDGAFAKLNGKVNNTNNANILCDIARMFPTPPSLEPNTAPSPYSSFINSDSNIEDYDRLTKESYYPLSPMDNFKVSF